MAAPLDAAALVQVAELDDLCAAAVQDNVADVVRLFLEWRFDIDANPGTDANPGECDRSLPDGS